MLAPSKPSTRKTARAPSRIWARFFSAFAVISIVFFKPWLIQRLDQGGRSFAAHGAGRRNGVGRVLACGIHTDHHGHARGKPLRKVLAGIDGNAHWNAL